MAWYTSKRTEQTRYEDRTISLNIKIKRRQQFSSVQSCGGYYPLSETIDINFTANGVTLFNPQTGKCKLLFQG